MCTVIAIYLDIMVGLLGSVGRWLTKIDPLGLRYISIRSPTGGTRYRQARAAELLSQPIRTSRAVLGARHILLAFRPFVVCTAWRTSGQEVSVAETEELVKALRRVPWLGQQAKADYHSYYGFEGEETITF